MINGFNYCLNINYFYDCFTNGARANEPSGREQDKKSFMKNAF